MSRRPRGLSPEEKELWSRIAASARPIRAEPHFPIDHGPKAKPKKPARLMPEFRIGELKENRPFARDTAPTIEERLAAQPLRMDRKAHRNLVRGRAEPEARIDLHGMTLAEAHPELIRFILSAQATGKRLVLVITGKGKRGDDHGPVPQRIGVLRHQVPRWLHEAPLGFVVQQVAPAHAKHGGAGALYVYLRRLR
ncbi:MAG: Smr/MutS family protein [Paracoccaceae bacterium]